MSSLALIRPLVRTHKNPVRGAGKPRESERIEYLVLVMLRDFPGMRLNP